jgi:hypothetical protein
MKYCVPCGILRAIGSPGNGVDPSGGRRLSPVAPPHATGLHCMPTYLVSSHFLPIHCRFCIHRHSLSTTKRRKLSMLVVKVTNTLTAALKERCSLKRRFGGDGRTIERDGPEPKRVDAAQRRRRRTDEREDTAQRKRRRTDEHVHD